MNFTLSVNTKLNAKVRERFNIFSSILAITVSLDDVKQCVKSVRNRSFSGLYFPAFGLNTERYRVSLRIQSKCGKIRTRKIPETDTFHAVKVSFQETQLYNTHKKKKKKKNDIHIY